MQITESSILAIYMTVSPSRIHPTASLHGTRILDLQPLQTLTTSPISGDTIHLSMRVGYGMRRPPTQTRLRPEVQMNLTLSV
jgi:hypothetical protein